VGNRGLQLSSGAMKQEVLSRKSFEGTGKEYEKKGGVAMTGVCREEKGRDFSKGIKGVGPRRKKQKEKEKENFRGGEGGRIRGKQVIIGKYRGTGRRKMAICVYGISALIKSQGGSCSNRKKKRGMAVDKRVQYDQKKRGKAYRRCISGQMHSGGGGGFGQKGEKRCASEAVGKAKQGDYRSDQDINKSNGSKGGSTTKSS